MLIPRISHSQVSSIGQSQDSIETWFRLSTDPLLCAQKVTAWLTAGDSSHQRIHWGGVVQNFLSCRSPPVKRPSTKTVNLAGEKVVILHHYSSRTTAASTFSWPDHFPLFLHSVRTTTGVVTIRSSIVFIGTKNQKIDFYIPILYTVVDDSDDGI